MTFGCMSLTVCGVVVVVRLHSWPLREGFLQNAEGGGGKTVMKPEIKKGRRAAKEEKKNIRVAAAAAAVATLVVAVRES